MGERRGLRAGRRLLGGMLWMLLLGSTPASADEPATPVYVPPLLGSAGVVVGAGSRGVSLGDLALCALAPDHVGLSSRASPTLYWFSRGSLPGPPRLTLTTAGTDSVLLDTELAIPAADGVHRLVLAEHGVALREDVDYRWELSLPSPRSTTDEALTVSGYIRYRPVPPAVSARFNGLNGAQLPAVYAGAGYWYDAVWLLSELIRAHPDEPRFREQRAALLETVPLPVVVAHDRAERDFQ